VRRVRGDLLVPTSDSRSWSKLLTEVDTGKARPAGIRSVVAVEKCKRVLTSLDKSLSSLPSRSFPPSRTRRSALVDRRSIGGGRSSPSPPFPPASSSAVSHSPVCPPSCRAITPTSPPSSCSGNGSLKLSADRLLRILESVLPTVVLLARLRDGSGVGSRSG
jgi:hypothetical protein